MRTIGSGVEGNSEAGSGAGRAGSACSEVGGGGGAGSRRSELCSGIGDGGSSTLGMARVGCLPFNRGIVCLRYVRAEVGCSAWLVIASSLRLFVPRALRFSIDKTCSVRLSLCRYSRAGELAHSLSGNTETAALHPSWVNRPRSHCGLTILRERAVGSANSPQVATTSMSTTVMPSSCML